MNFDKKEKKMIAQNKNMQTKNCPRVIDIMYFHCDTLSVKYIYLGWTP